MVDLDQSISARTALMTSSMLSKRSIFRSYSISPQVTMHMANLIRLSVLRLSLAHTQPVKDEGEGCLSEATVRQLNEVKLLASITNHPNIVYVS